MGGDDLAPPVKGMLEAANGGDLPRFLSGFTQDGVVDDWGREFRGTEQIKAWSDEEFIGKRVSVAVEGVERRGAETVVTAQVGGDGFNGPSHFTFEVAGDRISRLTIRG
jgi:hypothetical protein